MPLDVPGCTRATMIIAVSFYNTPVVRVFVVFFVLFMLLFICFRFYLAGKSIHVGFSALFECCSV